MRRRPPTGEPIEDLSSLGGRHAERQTALKRVCHKFLLSTCRAFGRSLAEHHERVVLDHGEFVASFGHERDLERQRVRSPAAFVPPNVAHNSLGQRPAKRYLAIGEGHAAFGGQRWNDKACCNVEHCGMENAGREIVLVPRGQLDARHRFALAQAAAPKTVHPSRPVGHDVSARVRTKARYRTLGAAREDGADVVAAPARIIDAGDLAGGVDLPGTAFDATRDGEGVSLFLLGQARAYPRLMAVRNGQWRRKCNARAPSSPPPRGVQLREARAAGRPFRAM